MVGVSALGIVGIETAVAAALVAGLLDAAARSQQQPVEMTVGRGLDALRSAAILGLLSPWQLVLQPQLQYQRASELVIISTLLAGVSFAVVDLLTLAIQERILTESPAIVGSEVIARPSFRCISFILLWRPLLFVSIPSSDCGRS